MYDDDRDRLPLGASREHFRDDSSEATADNMLLFADMLLYTVAILNVVIALGAIWSLSNPLSDPGGRPLPAGYRSRAVALLTPAQRLQAGPPDLAQGRAAQKIGPAKFSEQGVRARRAGLDDGHRRSVRRPVLLALPGRRAEHLLPLRRAFRTRPRRCRRAHDPRGPGLDVAHHARRPQRSPAPLSRRSDRSRPDPLGPSSHPTARPVTSRRPAGHPPCGRRLASAGPAVPMRPT